MSSPLCRYPAATVIVEPDPLRWDFIGVLQQAKAALKSAGAKSIVYQEMKLEAQIETFKAAGIESWSTFLNVLRRYLTVNEVQ